MSVGKSAMLLSAAIRSNSDFNGVSPLRLIASVSMQEA